MHQNAQIDMGNEAYLHRESIFTLVKDVGGRLAERVESVDQNETEHMSERQKKNLLNILFIIFNIIIKEY